MVQPQTASRSGLRRDLFPALHPAVMGKDIPMREGPADDHRAFLAGLPADQRADLCRTADGPGLLRAALHLRTTEGGYSRFVQRYAKSLRRGRS